MRPYDYLAAAALGAAILTSVSTAETVEYPLNTGNGLLAACTYTGAEQAEIEYHFGTCVGFIKGVTNAYTALMLAAGKQAPLCGRDGMDNGQIRDIVVKALRTSPEMRDQSSVALIIGAMTKAFPCS